MCFDLDTTTTNKGVSGAADSKISIFKYELASVCMHNIYVCAYVCPFMHSVHLLICTQGTCDIVKEIAINHAGVQDVRIREDGKIFATAGWDHR